MESFIVVLVIVVFAVFVSAKKTAEQKRAQQEQTQKQDVFGRVPVPEVRTDLPKSVPVYKAKPITNEPVTMEKKSPDKTYQEKSVRERSVGDRPERKTAKERPGRERPAYEKAMKNTTLAGMAENVSQNADNQMESDTGEENVGIGAWRDVVHFKKEAIDTRNLLIQVEDMMVTGVDFRLSYERDFIGEGIDMLARYENLQQRG
ncbi:MAG: hypothetical protein RR491_00130 [Lachnospiraceae bacterium]